MAFKLPSYSELNNTQKTVINLLGRMEKIAVIGGPGTGKTIIGLQAAALMSKSKGKCLFLSYSVSLCHYITNAANLFNLNIENIEINSYHKWFWHKLIALGYNPKDLQDKDYLYNLDKLETALNMKSEELKTQYDYIFIDEAQDVQEGLIKFFLQFGKKILVTFDDSQKIGNENSDALLSYDHSNILNDLKIGDNFFDLIDNYRNTVQIETIAKILFTSYDLNDISLKRVTSKRHGQVPKLIRFKEGNSFDDIAEYIVDNYDKSKSVGVLFSVSDQSHGKDLYDKLKVSLRKYTKLENINLLYKYGKSLNINSKNALSNGIYLMSLKTSKGLEFDEVYIIGENLSLENYQTKNSLYVAFTRAKNLTNIVLMEHDEKVRNQEFNKLIDSYNFLFDNIDLPKGGE